MREIWTGRTEGILSVAAGERLEPRRPNAPDGFGSRYPRR